MANVEHLAPAPVTKEAPDSRPAAPSERFSSVLWREFAKWSVAGLLSAALIAWFNYLSDERDLISSRLDQNLSQSIAIVDEISHAFYRRKYATYKVLSALEGFDVEKMKAEYAVYMEEVRRWNEHIFSLSDRSAIFLDAPRGIDVEANPKGLANIDCSVPFFVDTDGNPIPNLPQESTKASLEAIHHCFIKLHSSVWPIARRKLNQDDGLSDGDPDLKVISTSGKHLGSASPRAPSWPRKIWSP
jgi:hypothetical protein